MSEVIKCKICEGSGFLIEKGHDPNDMRPEHLNDGDCITCPVQIQIACNNCNNEKINKE